MLVICAWCKKQVGTKEPLSDTSATHTICYKCKEIYFPETVCNIPAKLDKP